MVRVNKPKKLLDSYFSKNPNKSMLNPHTHTLQQSINSSMYQIGRTLFYFRFENFKSHRVPKKEEKVETKSNAYSRWKGTIFSQKMKQKKTLELIPSEFVDFENKSQIINSETSSKEAFGNTNNSDMLII